MDVEDVQGFGLENFQHFYGEGEGVGGVIKEGIGNDGGLVEMDSRVVGVHADRRGVGDEVNVVPPGGEFLAQLGGDNAGAAVSGVASDANTHRGPRERIRSRHLVELTCLRGSKPRC